MNTLTVGNMAFSYSKGAQRHPTEKSLNSTHAKPTELFNEIVTVTKAGPCRVQTSLLPRVNTGRPKGELFFF